MKLRKIQAAGFRGLPLERTLDFADANGNPVSALLLGDNGSGKSSFVDAIEFGTQARVRGEVGRTAYQLARSLSAGGQPRVRLTVQDGRTSERLFALSPEGGFIVDHVPLPEFAVSPLVLRREDITTFWHTPESQRQIVFWDYFRGGPGAAPSATDVEDLKATREQIKARRKKARGEVAQFLGISEQQVTREFQNYGDFVRKHLNEGRTQRERKAMRESKKSNRAEGLRLVEALRTAQGDFDRVHTELTRAVRSHIDEKGKAAAKSFIGSVGARVSAAFAAISPAASFVDRVHIQSGTRTETSLSLSISLKSGKNVSPEYSLSEANLDLLALLLYFAVAQESAKQGQAKVLVLDDVFQSVDASVRVRTAEYMLKEFPDWQWIVTLHDRMWHEQLRAVLRSAGHHFVEHEIVRWSFHEGPVVRTQSREDESSLNNLVEEGPPSQICAEAGVSLERTCHALSHALPISVTRKRDDKYTLADLWPGVAKVLKKTSAAKAAEDVERWVALRNLAGAHYNEWALTLSRHEAVAFGEAVLELQRLTHCGLCGRWIEEQKTVSGATECWRCRCGSAVVSPAPKSKS